MSFFRMKLILTNKCLPWAQENEPLSTILSQPWCMHCMGDQRMIIASQKLKRLSVPAPAEDLWFWAMWIKTLDKEEKNRYTSEKLNQERVWFWSFYVMLYLVKKWYKRCFKKGFCHFVYRPNRRSRGDSCSCSHTEKPCETSNPSQSN